MTLGQINAKQNAITNTSRLNANLIHNGTVSNSEFSYLNGVTSGIQGQINAKQNAITSSNKLDASFIGGGSSNTSKLDSSIIPIASADVLGGVKIGNNLTVDSDGVISAEAAATSSSSVLALSDITKYSQKNIISCGSAHTAVLLNTGEVMTCGYNDYGQLGNNTTTTETTLVSMIPITPYDKTNAIAISCDWSNTAVLLNTGEVMTCGINNKGQLGNNTTTTETTLVSMIPVTPYDKTNVIAISCGTYHTVVLLNTGEVMACGDNSTGQLGNNTITGTTNTLVSMTLSEPYDKTNAVAISSGSVHTAVLLNTGEVMACGDNRGGYNDFSKLGNGNTTKQYKLITMNASPPYNKTNAVAISCGLDHTAILLNTGEVMGCGNNRSRQLGIIGIISSLTLVSMNASPPYNKSNAVVISTGAYHTAVLLNTGEVMACGRNEEAQLGIGPNASSADNYKDKLVSMLASGNYDKTNAIAISCGFQHTAVLLNTGGNDMW